MKTAKKQHRRNDRGISAAEFAAAFEKLFPENTAPAHISVAVSGGADSTALALLLADYVRETGRQLTALTVNHNLRPEAAAEAAATAAVLKKYGIACHILSWQPGTQKTALQKRAREARYRLMTQYCRNNGISVLLLAHHADDQAETFWMRLHAGSGIDGLACMQGLRRDAESGILIARPLLDFGKQDMEAVCAARNVDWIEDPSNTAPQFLRSRIRKTLATMPDEKAKILQSIGLFGRLREKLHRETAAATLDCAVFHAAGYTALDFSVWQAYPAEIRRRILLHIVQTLAGKPYPPRTRTADNALKKLEERPDCGVFTFGDCIFERCGNAVFISLEAAAMRPENVTQTAFRFGGWHITLPFLPETPLFCSSLGTRGLSFLPKGQRRDFEKRYKSLPRFARQALPVLETGGRIVAVPHLDWADSGVFGENAPVSAVFGEDIEIV